MLQNEEFKLFFSIFFVLGIWGPKNLLYTWGL